MMLFCGYNTKLNVFLMGEADRKKSRLLTADAAIPVAQIARPASLCQASAWNRNRRMEADGAVMGRVAEVGSARFARETLLARMALPI